MSTWIVLVLAALGWNIAAAQHVPKIADAVRTDAPPKMDGVLESEWFRAQPCADFIQRNPNAGEPASLPTFVYILYDRDAIYFGFNCIDTAPDSISGRIQRRDNDSRSDFLDIYLDTFHDNRNGYWWTVTAAGVQAEGTMFNETDLTANLDAVWESAVGRTDSGWVCEVRISFQSIRHGGPRADGWGLNFARVIHRRQEGSFWQPVDRDTGFRVSEMGLLNGLHDIAPAQHLEVLPHVVGRWDAPMKQDWRSENQIENLGAYVKVVPGSAWTVDLAYQPDFAQVDVDDEIINVSDYPVSISEKRPFFLEVQDLFNSTPYQMFYSRRIADPDYGGRIQFNNGKVQGTVLAGKNMSQDSLLQDAGAARVRWNLGKLHTVGITSTYLDDVNLHAAAGGVDGKFRWGQRDFVAGWLAGVDRTGTHEEPVETRAEVFHDFKAFLFDVAATYRGTDYNTNDMGFTPYSNVFRQAFWAGKEYFPATTMFESVGYDINGVRATLTDGTHTDGYANFGIYSRTRSNWRSGVGVEWGVSQRRRYVGDPIESEARDNFGMFNIQRYPSNYQWAWIYSDDRQPVEYGFDINRGSFRDGQRFNWIPSVVAKPRSNVEITGAFDWFRIWDEPTINNSEITDFKVWRFKVRYSPTLNIQLRGTVQWDDQEYFGSNDLLTNLLFSWNWHPGSWFYLVYDETARRPEPFDASLSKSQPGDRTIRTKLTYFFTVG